MTNDDGIYIGECELYSNDYCGKAVDISMRGCNLSTTHISMVLKPNQQKQLIDWFCKHKKQIVLNSLNGD